MIRTFYLACFPSVARVRLHNGKVVTMSELEIGDQVQTGITVVREKLEKCSDKIHMGHLYYF